MTQDDFPKDRAPLLGGKAPQSPTHNEPSLSLDRLLPGLREALESSDRGRRPSIQFRAHGRLGQHCPGILSASS